MSKLIVLTAGLFACTASTLVHAQSPSRQADAKSGFPGFYTTETVVVDEVLAADENGYRSNAYVVTWNNSRVAVEDNLARSHYRVGDKIKVLVMRHQVNDDPKMRLLHFAVAPEKRESSGSRE